MKSLIYRLSFKSTKALLKFEKWNKKGLNCKFYNSKKKLINRRKNVMPSKSNLKVLLRDVTKLKAISEIFWGNKAIWMRILPKFKMKTMNWIKVSMDSKHWLLPIPTKLLIFRKIVKNLNSCLLPRNSKKREFRMKLKRKQRSSIWKKKNLETCSNKYNRKDMMEQELKVS